MKYLIAAILFFSSFNVFAVVTSDLSEIKCSLIRDVPGKEFDVTVSKPLGLDKSIPEIKVSMDDVTGRLYYSTETGALMMSLSSASGGTHISEIKDPVPSFALGLHESFLSEGKSYRSMGSGFQCSLFDYKPGLKKN